MARTPHNAKLVRSIVINGDGAHGSNIYRLLSQAQHTRHILFFDFELGSTLEERTLCATVPLHNLTSLSFSVLPARFVDIALKECSDNIKSLRIYRVNLAAIDSQPWRHDKPRWNMPNLRALSLKHVGNISHEVFRELIANTSSHLNCLKIYYESPHELCRDKSMWKDCRFKDLERLELGSFASDVVSSILRNLGSSPPSLHTLKLPYLRNCVTLPEFESVLPSESDHKAASTLLSDIPSSVKTLEFQACRDAAICRQLPDYLERHTSWLPKLLTCPSLTVGEITVKEDELAVLRVSYFAAARRSGLRLPEGSQYYSLKGCM